MKSRATLRIVALYALVSALWIILSDAFLRALAFDLETTRRVEVLKGMGFVLVTTLALYGLINAYGRRLAQSETEYRALFVSNPNPMWVYDVETLAFLAVNDAAVEKYGYSRDEFLTMTIADIRPPEDVPRLLENVEMVDEGIDEAGLWRHLTKDGTLLWVDITSHVTEFEQRRAELVLVQDMTAAIEARRDLTRVNERMQTIIDVAPVAIIVLDLNDRVTLWNPAAERMFGWTAAEALGKPLPIVPARARDDHRERFGEVLEGPSHIGVEVTRVRKDGSSIIVRLNSVALTDDEGVPIGALGLLEDVSEAAGARAELERYRDHLEELVRERTMELTEANQRLSAATAAKSAFLANTSHELRTPLNSIIGFTAMLLQGMAGSVNDEQRRQLEMVQASGQHLLSLIDDILDLSRIEMGRIEIRFERVRAGELARTMDRMFGSLAAQENLAWSCDCDDATEFVTDPRLVEQILMNLLSNAVKYTAEGSVGLRVMSDDSVVRFEVADTGPGIRPEVQAVIFDEFERAPETRQAAVQGTGLGLAISSRLATLLGGHIELASVVGEGSTFTLVLPVAHELADRDESV